MISLNRINGSHVWVNPDLIRLIESTPDTILTFVDGEKLLVKDSPPEVVKRILEFRRQCLLPPSAPQASAKE